MNIAHDADNGQQVQITVHVPEFDRAPDWIFVWPSAARQRFADHCNMHRVGAVSLIEDSSPHERYSQHTKVSVSYSAEVCIPPYPFLLEQLVKASRGLWNLVLIHEQKHPLGQSAIHQWQATSRPYVANNGDLLQPIDQARIENPLPDLSLRIFDPW